MSVGLAALETHKSSGQDKRHTMSLSPHAARVTRLYRASLKNLMNWCVHRDLFIEQGNLLRAEFNANMHVKDPRLIEKIVSDGEAKLLEYQHPDPYTCARPSLDPFFSPAVDGALFPRALRTAVEVML